MSLAGGVSASLTLEVMKQLMIQINVAFESYETITTVQVSMHKNHHPNVTAVAGQLAAGNSVAMNQMVQYALSCIPPGLQYFTTKLGHSLRESLAAFDFKAETLLNSQKFAEMLSTPLEVDDLVSFPFATSAVLSHLEVELPSYICY